jgi:hypothetical protein
METTMSEEDFHSSKLFNKFLVGMRGNKIVIGEFRRELDKEDALLLAAWIVVLADDSNDFIYFDDMLEEILENNDE